MKKWVIFDAMGVIFKVGDDVGELLVPYIRAKNMNITSKRINERYLQASLGEISSKEFWESLGFGELYPQIERDYLFEHLELDDQFINVASKLGEDYGIAMLSNDIGDWSRSLREMHGVETFFDEVVISGDVGCRKPSKEIYEIVLARTGASSKDCVFIDDNERNLIPAAKLGMKTILFSRNARNPSGETVVKSLQQLINLVPKIF